MAVYEDIINWSTSKPMFVRDAIRRMLNNQTISSQDFEEIKNLLKKENGFDGIHIIPVPVSVSDIPTITHDNKQIRLNQICSPHNIAALFDNTPLEFSINGLTIVYGKNGSGKSSYSKILKKLCWSRDKNVLLKKNVYTGDKSVQSVKIKFKEGPNDQEFIWNEGQKTDKRLNSIFVFDTKCANIYLNSENPSEYKPVGIDVLERLVKLFGALSVSFDNDLSQLRQAKPQLPDRYKTTNIFNWYQGVESLEKHIIEEKLVFSEQQKEDKKNLESSLKDSNLSETNKNLRHKKERYSKLRDRLKDIELLFNDEGIKVVDDLQKDYAIKRQASLLAQKSYETDTEFSIGGQAWRALWNAARQYAIQEVHTCFPVTSNDNGTFCPLCHQPLSIQAQDRLKKFDLYIQDRTSVDFEQSKKKLDAKRNEYIAIPIKLIEDDLRNEIIEDNPILKDKIDEYESQISKAKNCLIDYLNYTSDKILSLPSLSFTTMLTMEIDKIDRKIKTNEEILNDRSKIEKDFLELEAINYLVNVKSDILHYIDEYIIKQKINACKNSINTRGVSSKIGEILESNAISTQHGIFIQYLTRLNPNIAAKMELRKTKTAAGVTYQKCGFNSISEDIVEILSEGEQKIVAIANFLSECTVDNAKNTIVFDDPINSLDIDYRESIADIIVELSGDRQIIVMTHDLYFLRLLKDIYKNKYSNDCCVTCLNSINDNSGIVSDEIPYLAKNVQERIDTITKGLDKIKSLNISQIDQKRILLNDLKDKMRQLLERTVEDILINKTITRFSKNINFKKGNLANIIVVEKNDVDYLLSLYGKYSEVIHDGSIETVPNLIEEGDIQNDIYQYKQWKDGFVQRAKDWKNDNGYNVSA